MGRGAGTHENGPLSAHTASPHAPAALTACANAKTSSSATTRAAASITGMNVAAALTTLASSSPCCASATARRDATASAASLSSRVVKCTPFLRYAIISTPRRMRRAACPRQASWAAAASTRSRTPTSATTRRSSLTGHFSRSAARRTCVRRIELPRQGLVGEDDVARVVAGSARAPARPVVLGPDVHVRQLVIEHGLDHLVKAREARLGLERRDDLLAQGARAVALRGGSTAQAVEQRRHAPRRERVKPVDVDELRVLLAQRAESRSRSGSPLSVPSRSASRSEASPASSSTMSCRFAIAAGSSSGWRSHCSSIRSPILLRQ